jgi:hypothetical protein
MSFKDWLGLGDQVAKPIEAVQGLYTTDKARIEAEKDYEEVAQKPILAQLSNNAIMAASSQLFNSGWQSMIGWSCGFLIMLYYVPQLVIITWIWGVDCLDMGLVKPFPMKADDLLNLVYLLFGFGAHSLFKKN